MLALGARMVRSTDPRLLWKFGYNFGFKGMLSVQRFKKRLKQGQVFPPFLYVSIINSCNLRCTGLLGRRRRAAGEDLLRGHGPADPERQAATATRSSGSWAASPSCTRS